MNNKNTRDKSNSKSIVLVVDDAIDSVHMLNDLLEENQFTVLVALEGAQALTITNNIQPDIILLDALMPHMDGFETCKRLKQNPQLSDVPIIFMTGLSDTEHVVMGLNAGGVDYVTKPINPQELIARMRVHLTNAQISQRAHQALDSAGQYLLTLDLQGQLIWATPEVYRLLEAAGATAYTTILIEPVQQQLNTWLNHSPETGHQLILQNLRSSLRVEMLNFIDRKEYLLRLSNPNELMQDLDSLKQKFEVTQREAEVLLWIANGKTNREIAQILNMSPRTVNKHLEQIFKKLGVENRTSAAGLVIKALAKN
jgi:DNA-binding NarL/FixJ family response regulator